MEILIDFQKVIGQANQLESLAEMLRKEGSEHFADALAELSQAWTGAAAEEYLKKGERFQGKLNATAKDLAQTACIVREIAQTLYEAEQKAVALAQTRNG